MKFGRTDRNFGVLEHKVYPPEPGVTKRLAQHSSAIDLEDCGKPGSSFLWIGDDFHLNRGEVKEFVQYLQSWLDTGNLDHNEC